MEELIGRKEELVQLNHVLTSKKAELIAIIVDEGSAKPF